MVWLVGYDVVGEGWGKTMRLNEYFTKNTIHNVLIPYFDCY